MISSFLKVFCLVFVVLLFECLFLSWNKSSLRRILLFTKSARTDLFYFFFWTTFGFALGHMLGALFHFTFISSYNVVVQFLFLALVETFFGYWHHRMMHSECLWKFHKVHHSATEFNGITTFRNHPIDFVVNIPILMFLNSFAGLNPYVTLLYGTLNAVYQMLVHSDMQWPFECVIKYIVVNPAMHKVHHSIEQKHYNRNFGSLSIWDIVFGTYHEPDSNCEIGVKD